METADELIETLKLVDTQINNLRSVANEAKLKLFSMAKFSSGVNTARVQGEKYKCKIQLPSKIAWNQKALSEIKKKYAANNIIQVGTYKVNTIEYKKIINTVGDDDFNNFRNDLMAANMGTIGTPVITIEG